MHSKLAATTLALVLLGGCATRAQQVLVPVAVRPAPPAAITAPLDTSRLPVFVVPSDPRASSALTAEGERDLKTLLIDLLSRVRSWEAWAE